MNRPAITIRDAVSEDAASIVELVQELAETDNLKSPIHSAYVEYYLVCFVK